MMDDILVYGATQDEHDTRLQRVLKCLHANGVTLNKAKCVFSTTSVKFISQIIGEGTVRPDPEEVSALLRMPHPPV